MTAILSLPRAVFAIRAMEECDILMEIWPEPADIDALERLKNADKDASAPLGLAVLYEKEGDGVGRRLRLSNAEKAIRMRALSLFESIVPKLSDHAVRKLIYTHGKDGFSDAIATAHAFQRIDNVERWRLLGFADDWEAPDFPFSGRDVIAVGFEPGPAVAALLNAVETQWIDEDFPGKPRAEEIFQAVLAAQKTKTL